MGGTGALVDGLCKLMGEVGIELDLGRTVEEIDVSDGQARGVRLADGETLEADVVVANADAPFVYRHMIAPEHRRRWSDRRLEKLKYSMGLFVAYFGARRSYPELAHHEIHLGPRYRGLLDDIFEHRRLADDFSLYLHAPTRTDPSLAPEGCESMYALIPVPNLRAEIDWEDEGPRLRDRLYEQLERTVCPELTDQVCEDSFVTPRHFGSNLLSMHGAGFSIQPILRQSAYFRFHNRSEDVENLFFVGAGTHPGAGIPGVLMTAKVLDRIVPAVGHGGKTTSGRSAAHGPPTVPRSSGSADSDDVERATAAMETFRDRARTFSLASRLFPRSRRREIATLYAFCRHIDDLADLEPSSSGSDLRSPRESLEQVRSDLRAGSSADPVVARFLELAELRDIDLLNAELLVAGAESDLDGVRMGTVDELLQYCYRVASTVGLMVCDLVGVRAESARRHAVDLGIAMQLTNIARDVAEDAAMDRVYLPSELIAPDVIERALAGESDEAVDLYAAVLTLLEEAGRRYRSGDLGLSHLPTRIRWGVLAASRNYEAIGRRISRLGPGYWHERVVVGTTSKVARSLLALTSWSFLGRPWSSATSEPERIAVPELEDSASVAGPAS
jgi:phytoene/squalene synthetase